MYEFRIGFVKFSETIDIRPIWYRKPFGHTWSTTNVLAKLECHDFGRKKASKNSIVAPTLNRDTTHFEEGSERWNNVSFQDLIELLIDCCYNKRDH